MMIPFDDASLVSAALAVMCVCIIAADRWRPAAALWFVLGTALLIRADAAYQFSLHEWDERFHAVVATHLMRDSLQPMLFPVGHPDVANGWMRTDIWLHKPPLAMWLMAASMTLAGVNEIALRAPSVLLGTVGVWLTYRTGLALGSARLATAAAAFHAVNGFVVSLGAGRRVADHVDVALMVCVQAAVLVTMTVRPGRTRGLWVGVATGLAVLSKSLPGALPLALLLCAQRQPLRARFDEVATALIATIAVAGPWFAYCAVQFPDASQREWAYTAAHLGAVVEGHAGPWWYYLASAPRYFGEQLPAAMILGALALHRRPWGGLVAAWIAIPFVIFSAAATKLPNMVMIAAPALFLLNAAALDGVRRWTPAGRGGVLVRWALVVVLAVVPVRSLLEPQGPLERRDRFPEHAQAYRSLQTAVPSGTTQVFNVPDPVTAMFYTHLTVVGRLPSDQEVKRLHEEGRPVVIVSPASRRPAVPEGWRAFLIDWPDSGD